MPNASYDQAFLDNLLIYKKSHGKITQETPEITQETPENGQPICYQETM